MKKLLCIFVSALLAAGVFGVTASAANETVVEFMAFDTIEPGNYLSPAEGVTTAINEASYYDELFDTIYYSLANMESTIDFTKFNFPITEEYSNIIGKVYNYVTLLSPELFLGITLGDLFSGVLNSNNEPIIKSIDVSYDRTKTEYNEQYKEYKQELDSIVAAVPQGLTDLEKVLYTYNYLALNFRYEQNSYNVPNEDRIRDVYNFFTKGEGVCYAYSQAFIAIMNELGIKATYAIDDAHNHAWNIVYLDGKPYHIDCTHADPISKVTVEEKIEDDVKQVTYCYDTAGLVSYDHFLKSDNTINACEEHSEYTTYEEKLFGTDISCTDTAYDSGYVWLNSTVASPFTYCDGSWYYMDYNGDKDETWLVSTDNTFKSADYKVVKIDDVWDADGGGNWLGYFGSIFTFGNEVCYSTPEGFSLYNPQTGSITELSCEKYDLGSNSIYGCSYDGHGNIKVLCQSSPNDVPKNNITVKVSMGSNAAALTATQKFIITGECDKNWGYFDVSGDIGIDIRDLVALKKRAASVSVGDSGGWIESDF